MKFKDIRFKVTETKNPLKINLQIRTWYVFYLWIKFHLKWFFQ